MFGYTPAQLKKALLALVTFAVNLVTVALTVGNVIPDVALPWIAVFLGVAGTYGVFKAKNAEVVPAKHAATLGASSPATTAAPYAAPLQRLDAPVEVESEASGRKRDAKGRFV